MDALVSTKWLAAELGAADLVIVDATYVDAALGRDPAAEFAAAHIPGAVFMDLAALRDTATDLPNMLPSAEKFASRMRSLGVGDRDRIVLYDHSPWHTAARAWWMLRTFGARDVAILDGGLARWQAEGRETASGARPIGDRPFTAAADAGAERTLDQMRANLASGAEQVVDARSAARFTGAEPDPRPATLAGHIPGSRSLPYGAMFAADGRWKRSDALAAAFRDAGIDPARPVVATCGSGITAAVLAFGLHLLGSHAAIYDGSWSEWGADRTTPKATGAA
jgi:thiosulfate/3-mercaptopyruvate sulfurtransferase